MRRFTTLLLALAAFTAQARADCACGYRDPSTGFLWSERVITYWNETAAAQADLVTDPAISPAWMGEGIAGDTGSSNNQSWSVISAPVNDWEDGFSSTFRTGYDPSNVRLVNTSAFQGLAMDVTPAIINNHTIWGSALVSRRRDILYGSFRTMVQTPNIEHGGSAFAMHARYNSSETVDLGVYGGDYTFNKSTFRWSYSASGHPATPVISNMTFLGDNAKGFLEHRFDWTRIPGITFANSANMGNYSQSSLYSGGADHHVPTTPATFSYRHWATGETSESQGPPMGGTATSLVVYTRLFFNSSSPQRVELFEAQCAASSDAVCSTDDLTLRGSTPFDLSLSGLQYFPAQIVFQPKLWSIICLSIWLGISLILFLHAMARRYYTKRQKIKAFYAANNEQPSASAGAEATNSDGGEMNNNSSSSNSSYMEHLRPALAHLPASSSSRGGRAVLHTSRHEDLMDVRCLVTALGESDQGSVDKNSYFEQAFHKWNHVDDKNNDDDDDDDDDENKGTWEDDDDEDDEQNHNSHQIWDSALDTRHSMGTLSLPILNRDNGVEGVSTSALYYNSNQQQGGNTGAPVIKRWKRKEEPENDMVISAGGGAAATTAIGNSLAVPEDGTEMLPRVKPSFRELLRRFGALVHKWVFIDESAVGKTASGQNKVAYLGSLRGFAAFAVTLGHWTTMFLALPLRAEEAYDPNLGFHYPRSFYFGWKVSVAVVTGGAASFRFAMFFVLPARILGTRYLMKGGLGNLADSSIRRMPRIMFPVFISCFLEYFLMEVSTFRWISRLPSRTWNVWSYFQNYGSLGEFLNSFISLWFVTSPDQPAVLTRYAIGVLWTIPLMIQLTWTLFLCAIIARQITNHKKRWAFYSACLFFNWYANRFDTLFIVGLAVADLDCKLNYRQRSKEGIPIIPQFLRNRYPSLQKVRVPGQVFAWIIFFVGFGFTWTEVSGFGPRFVLQELRLRPDFFTANPKGWANPNLTLAYNDLKFTCILPVLSFYLLCDLNALFAKAFSLRIWQLIGKHSFGVFLLHGAIFWSWGAFCMIKLLVAGLPYWAAHLVAIITSYAMLAVVAVIFTNTGDKWGSWVSVALWRAVSRGYGRRVPGKQ